MLPPHGQHSNLDVVAKSLIPVKVQDMLRTVRKDRTQKPAVLWDFEEDPELAEVLFELFSSIGRNLPHVLAPKEILLPLLVFTIEYGLTVQEMQAGRAVLRFVTDLGWWSHGVKEIPPTAHGKKGKKQKAKETRTPELAVVEDQTHSLQSQSQQERKLLQASLQSVLGSPSPLFADRQGAPAGLGLGAAMVGALFRAVLTNMPHYMLEDLVNCLWNHTQSFGQER